MDTRELMAKTLMAEAGANYTASRRHPDHDR